MDKMLNTTNLFHMYPDAFSYTPAEQCKSVWTLSTGRCGTAILTNLLAISREIVSFHEPVPRMWNLSAEAYLIPEATHISDCVYTAKRDVISIAHAMGCVYSETNHRNSYLAYAIKRSFPNAKFIFLKRNAEDTIRSAYQKKMYHPENIYVSDRPTFSTIWDSLTEEERLALYWYYTNDFILKFVGNLDREDWFYLDYDKHIKGKDVDTIQSIFHWLGCALPMGSAVDIKRMLSTPINKGRSKRNEPIITDSVRAMCEEDGINKRLGELLWQ